MFLSWSQEHFFSLYCWHSELGRNNAVPHTPYNKNWDEVNCWRVLEEKRSSETSATVYKLSLTLPKPVAAQSKAVPCSLSLGVILGLNPARAWRSVCCEGFVFVRNVIIWVWASYPGSHVIFTTVGTDVYYGCLEFVSESRETFVNEGFNDYIKM